MPLLGDDYVATVGRKGRPLSDYKKGLHIHTRDKSCTYSYTLSANPGADFDPDFKPDLTPQEILSLGAFEGKYMTDGWREFPREWFIYAAALGRLSSDPDPSINYFQIKSRQPLSVWQRNGWAPPPCKKPMMADGILADPRINHDERGWFQWYCRYWIGRRDPVIDKIQIARWRAFRRHAGQIKAHCRPGDLTCRPKQRQALLQWAYNPMI